MIFEQLMIVESENYRKTTACAKQLFFCLSFRGWRFAKLSSVGSADHASSGETFLHGKTPENKRRGRLEFMAMLF